MAANATVPLGSDTIPFANDTLVAKVLSGAPPKTERKMTWAGCSYVPATVTPSFISATCRGAATEDAETPITLALSPSAEIDK